MKQNTKQRISLRLPSNHPFLSVPQAMRSDLASALLSPVKAWLDIQDTMIAIENRLTQLESDAQAGTCNTVHMKTNNAPLQVREIDIAEFLSAFDVE